MTCDAYDSVTMRPCQLRTRHTGPHRYTVGDCCAAIEGFCNQHRCTSRLYGQRCEGPGGHAGDHGAVVRWNRDGSTAARDLKTVDIEPGSEMVVKVNGMTIPVIVQQVNLQHETERIDTGFSSLPGMRSINLTVDLTSIGEVVVRK